MRTAEDWASALPYMPEGQAEVIIRKIQADAYIKEKPIKESNMPKLSNAAVIEWRTRSQAKFLPSGDRHWSRYGTKRTPVAEAFVERRNKTDRVFEYRVGRKES